MARIRTIKPEFFTSEDIVVLTPLSRLFYVSLWCESDREGRLEWKPRTFKLRYFPADDCNIEEMGQELIDNNLIRIYEIDGMTYAEIPGFRKHQVINNRESESVLPPNTDASTTRESGVLGEGRKGREGKARASTRKISMPKDFSISSRVIDWANEKKIKNLQGHLENFKLACEAKDYKYKDWDSAFMTAIRKDWAGLNSGKNSQPTQEDLAE